MVFPGCSSHWGSSVVEAVAGFEVVVDTVAEVYWDIVHDIGVGIVDVAVVGMVADICRVADIAVDKIVMVDLMLALALVAPLVAVALAIPVDMHLHRQSIALARGMLPC